MGAMVHSVIITRASLCHLFGLTFSFLIRRGLNVRPIGWRMGRMEGERNRKRVRGDRKAAKAHKESGKD